MNWQQHLTRMDKLASSDPQKWQLAEQFLQALGGQFLEGHQVVQNRTEGEVELRGRYQQYPVRLKLEMDFGLAEWRLKGANPAGTELDLHWDMDAVPDVGHFHGAAADDWGDDDEAAKFFFGKGYFLNAEPNEADRQLAIYQSLPEQVRQALATYVPGDRIRYYVLKRDGSQSLIFKQATPELEDPLNHLARGPWLMAQVAWGLAQVDAAALPQPAQPAPDGIICKMTCGFCGTLYLWSQNQTCPNCGAPPKA